MQFRLVKYDVLPTSGWSNGEVGSGAQGKSKDEDTAPVANTGFATSRFSLVFRGDCKTWCHIIGGWVSLMTWFGVFWFLIRGLRFKWMLASSNFDAEASDAAIASYAAFATLAISVLSEVDAASVGGCMCMPCNCLGAVSTVLFAVATVATVLVFTAISNADGSGGVPIEAVAGIGSVAVTYLVAIVCFTCVDFRVRYAVSSVVAYLLVLVYFAVLLTAADVIGCHFAVADNDGCSIRSDATRVFPEELWIHHYQMGLSLMLLGAYGNGPTPDDAIVGILRRFFTLLGYVLRAVGFGIFVHGVLNYGPDFLTDNVKGYSTTGAAAVVGAAGLGTVVLVCVYGPFCARAWPRGWCVDQ